MRRNAGESRWRNDGGVVGHRRARPPRRQHPNLAVGGGQQTNAGALNRGSDPLNGVATDWSPLFETPNRVLADLSEVSELLNTKVKSGAGHGALDGVHVVTVSPVSP